ncbi:MAG: radical SAM protein, partial [Butyrivibrio sp.]|nr:radical SAM protein [Butyrivibrio sp.]
MPRCNVCHHSCNLSEGDLGLCKARKCENGVVKSDNYGVITSIALDPIEKKPINLFYPGSKIISVGSYGCNLRCPFCQNH